MPSIINATTTNGLVTSADNSGSLQLATNSGTTAVTIDTSQRVGVGTASPSSRLDVNTSAVGNFVARITNNSGASSTDNALLVETSTASGARIISARNGGVERFSINGDGDVNIYNTLKFNSGYGSSEVAYGCRAWVNFNGTGTVAIRASGNVSSITDLNDGEYRVNYTNAMIDTNYAIAGSTVGSQETSGGFLTAGIQSGGVGSPLTTSCTITTRGGAQSRVDASWVHVTITR